MEEVKEEIKVEKQPLSPQEEYRLEKIKRFQQFMETRMSKGSGDGVYFVTSFCVTALLIASIVMFVCVFKTFA